MGNTTTAMQLKRPDDCQRIPIQMIQNILLIWLDNKIDDNSDDYRNTISQLRRTVNTINTFTNGDQCIKFLENINDEKVCLIISGTLGQHIVPYLHNMSQIDSIFIFCKNKTYHEQWTKDWLKIKGVFIEINSICQELKQIAQQCEQNAIPISIMNTTTDMNEKNLDQLDSSFMYTQIVKEILLTIQFDQRHIKEFIEYCRNVLNDNENEMENIDKLERKYHEHTPIWWYTYECFLYPMLNRALRLMDSERIIKLGFFISDLHRHIEQLHKEQFTNEILIVYRGQGMNKIDFQKILSTKGGLLSFNNFLSTSKDNKIAMNFTQRAAINPDMIGIFFIIKIDPSQSTSPYASIVDVSYYDHKENEVLFSMHTIFRINDIIPFSENQRIFRVELTLISDKDHDLRILTDYIRKEIFLEGNGWYRLGLVLMRMGQFDKAQEIYEKLLDEETSINERALIYDKIARTKCEIGKYKEAIVYYEKLLQIKEKTLSPNDPNLGAFYQNIGIVYMNMGKYRKALQYQEKNLEISQQILSSNHPNLANSYNNIGATYSIMKEYTKALSYFEKALHIRQQSLPSNHPDLGSSYYNIGTLYGRIREYTKAIIYFKKDLEISEISLPSNHPSLAASYNNIGLQYELLNNYQQARSFYDRALTVAQQASSLSSSDIRKYRRNFQRVSKKVS